MLVALGVFVLGLVVYLANPYWYGDATWYALDVGAWPKALAMDAGHIAWRPLATALWLILRRVVSDLDPLVPLRVLSSMATACLVLATYHLASRLGMRRRDSIAAATLVGLSKVCMAYGGSGCSYVAAAACGTIAMVPLVRRDGREWTAIDGALSALAMTLAWCMWGLAGMLLFPQLVLAALASAGGFGRRLARSMLLASVTLGAIIVAALVGFLLTPVMGRTGGFLAWMASSGHGTPPKFSILGLARAGLGFLSGFIHLGALGTSVKGLLLADRTILGSAVTLGFLLVAMLFVALVVTAIHRLGRLMRQKNPAATKVFLLAAAALAPVAGFAVLWKGSDVERFCLAVPFVAIALIFGLASSKGSTRGDHARGRLGAAWVLVAFTGLVNIAAFAAPRLMASGGLVMGLGRTAGQHLRSGDLLVVTGQNLGADVFAATWYFEHIAVFSVSFDVQTNGSKQWDTRLQQALCGAVKRGARIAVLSDLKGQPTPGGVGLSPVEFPTPTDGQLVSLLSTWHTVATWNHQQYSFLQIAPDSPDVCRDVEVPEDVRR